MEEKNYILVLQINLSGVVYKSEQLSVYNDKIFRAANSSRTPYLPIGYFNNINLIDNDF